MKLPTLKIGSTRRKTLASWIVKECCSVALYCNQDNSLSLEAKHEEEEFSYQLIIDNFRRLAAHHYNTTSFIILLNEKYESGLLSCCIDARALGTIGRWKDRRISAAHRADRIDLVVSVPRRKSPRFTPDRTVIVVVRGRRRVGRLFLCSPYW